jgi:teichoic acid transport system ATP-binding protein
MSSSEQLTAGNAIRVRGLTKTYKIYPSSIARAVAPFRRSDTSKKFTALKNVTIDFPKGEVVAILGKNGSGKSTLLKIITGVARQTSGEVEVDGRISAMLELTSGFDPQLTGVENIYLRALALGIPREEADARKEEIIRFADIGEHINQPVRTYSSGMKARLGFAVSVSVNPDILIVDEVLAVGDAIFRLKCIEKMGEFRKEGKTILFVSHSLSTVKAFCTKAVWINEGVVMEKGDLGPVVMAYEEFLKQERARTRAQHELDHPEEQIALEKRDILQIKRFRMFNAEDTKTSTFDAGDDIWFEFDYFVKRPMDRLTFCYSITNAEDLEIYVSDKQSPESILKSEVGDHHLRVRLKNPPLMGGQYFLSGELWDNTAGFFINHSRNRSFIIQQTGYVGTGITQIDYELQND